MQNHLNTLLLGALLAIIAFGSPARAQSGILPAQRTVDENGIDLGTGTFILNFEEAAIGSGPARLPLIRVSVGDQPSQWDELVFRQQVFPAQGEARARIGLPGQIEQKFVAPLSGGEYVAELQYGESLDTTAAGFEYLTGDGARIAYDFRAGLCSIPMCGGALPASRIIYPNGNIVSFTYNYFDTTSGLDKWRIASISNSYGYSIEFAYQAGGSAPGTAPPAGWFNRTSATFKKSGVTQFTVTYAYPSAGTVDITIPGPATWRVTATSIKRPNEATPGFVVAGSPKVTSATRDGVTFTYSYTTSPAYTTTRTNALGQSTVYTFDAAKNIPLSIKDGLNRTTSYQYDAQGRLTRITQPEGNYVEYTLDSRGNATTMTAVATSGSGLANIVTSATYDATCTNQKTCNKPNTTTDARGNITDYTYNATHGGVLTVTPPAPTVGAVRPQTRYSYTAVGGVYSLTGISACATGSAPACVGTVDESRGAMVFDTAGNMTSSTARDGSGTLMATSTMTFDGSGNLLTVDGPLTGADDTTRYRYDAARRLIGVVGPNPDGIGPLKHRATRNSYRTDGQLSKVERGTVTSQSDPAWAAFAPIETIDIGFDTNNRPITRKLSGSAGAAALTQQSYDVAGRVECVATRMNTAIYGSLPASACTLGTAGSFGADRIAKSLFDAAGQVTQQQVAVSTTDAATEATLTYTNNGKLMTLKDSLNNLTTYEYDGHDRQTKTRFPLPAQGANASSTTDYELRGYDPNGNVTSFRNRANQTTNFTFDKLNRATLKNLVAGELDVTYGYDSLGRLTSAGQTGTSLSFAYDALSRNLTQTGPQGTICSNWDLAGRRTRLAYEGSCASPTFWMDYDYLVTGEMTKVRENGATSGVGVLASYGYDDLGRRTSLTFGNGASQAYGYDPISRLNSLTNELTGITNDLSATFAYNPASQIASTVRTGDAYAWTGHFNINVTGTANGLNQLTSVGPKSLTHDTKGNVTAYGTRNFTYSSENLMLTGPNGTTLSYDPQMRLQQIASGGTTTKLAYDRLDRIAEYDSGNVLQRRYVHGPNMDEPLVWYEGAGTTDRRFLSSDERGSIISVTDSSGAVLGVNRYDEYGQPQASNLGVFGYAGQAWLPTVGLWYYKARAYDPELGRFLQTDPIDVAGGINLYAYVGNDPVNFIDPLGLDIVVVGARESYISETTPIIGPLGTARFGNFRTAFDPSTRLEDVVAQRERQECLAAADCFIVAGTRRRVADTDLPLNSAIVLAGRRIFDEFGDLVGLHLPGYRLLRAPKGGGYLLVPPGYKPGSRNGVVRIQPAGTGSSRYNPGGYYVVYDSAGRAIDVYTGQPHKDTSPLVHNPLGRMVPWVPGGF